jgi:ABC-2 type transport system permease protein
LTKAPWVARWEYLERIKSKAFIVSLFLMPVIMLGVGFLPTMLATRPDTATKSIGVVDQQGTFLEPLSRSLEERYKLPDGRPNYLLRAIPVTGEKSVAQTIHEADSLALAEEIEGYLFIPAAGGADTALEYRSGNLGNIRITERLTGAVRDIVTERRLRERGLNPSLVKELTSPVGLKTIRLSKTGEARESGFEQAFFTSYIFMMMLFFLVMTSGQLLVRSILEEKSNRVVEILLSSCSARDLMTGKILGLSGLGLTQMALWVAIGIAVSAKFAITLIPLGSALLLGLYFAIGYIQYAAIFVAAGAPVSTEQEAQQINSYLVLILVIPIAVAFTAIQDPHSTLVRVLTFVPLLTPSMMALRIPIQMPSTPEIITTLLLLAASAAGAMWLAGKIFRTTMLAYGKRPSLGELMTMIRSH